MTYRRLAEAGALLWGASIAIALPASGLSLTANPLALAAILFPALSIALPWLTRDGFARRHPRTAAAIASAGMLAAFSLMGSITSYIVAAATQGWADDRLIAMGGPLEGFWPTYWRWFAVNRWIGLPLDWAYLTIFATPTLLAAALAWAGHQARLDRLVLAYALALVVTNALFALAPATSAGAHFLRAGDPMMPQPGFMHIAVIEALRSGALRSIDLGAMVGLIAFPSFHAAAAILFLWASRPTGRLRLFFVPANLMMLVATPTTGGHYLIECIAGIAVALTTIAGTRAMVRRPVRTAAQAPVVAT